jgi:hypothetical protein
VISDWIEAAVARPLRAGLVLVAIGAVLLVTLNLVGGGDDPSRPAADEPTATASPTPPAVPRTATPRPTYRTTNDPQPIAVTFVRSWLLADVSRAAWLDGVTANVTGQLAEGLAATDRATIPKAGVASRPLPVVEGGIEQGGAKVTVYLDDGSAVIVTLQYDEEADPNGRWVVSNIVSADRP